MARSSALPVLMLPKVIACNPDKDIFDIGREAIGCDWIELVEAEPLAKDGLLMMIDEEGKLKPGGALINATASALYEELAEINHRLKIETFHGDEELTGMVNTHRRLRILLGENSGISLGRSDLGGMKVEIHLEFSGEGKPNV